jgi:hypothetical protein
VRFIQANLFAWKPDRRMSVTIRGRAAKPCSAGDVRLAWLASRSPLVRGEQALAVGDAEEEPEPGEVLV